LRGCVTVWTFFSQRRWMLEEPHTHIVPIHNRKAYVIAMFASQWLHTQRTWNAEPFSLFTFTASCLPFVFILW